jgi:hypothetical protein
MTGDVVRDPYSLTADLSARATNSSIYWAPFCAPIVQIDNLSQLQTTSVPTVLSHPCSALFSHSDEELR